MPLRPVDPSEAVNHKFPEWLIFLTTHDPDGPDDIMPVGWCMQCAEQPIMFAVGLKPVRHSLELIRKTGEFNLLWAGEGQHDLITFTGTRSGREVDKLAEAGVETYPGKVNQAPLIAGTALAFECRFRHEYPTGDHLIVVGEVVAAHLSEPAVRSIVNFGGRYLPAVGVE